MRFRDNFDGAEIAAAFAPRSVAVYSTAGATEADTARAFLLVAASIAAQAGMSTEEFAQHARRFVDCFAANARERARMN